jgi:copper(I)-binding protein
MIAPLIALALGFAAPAHAHVSTGLEVTQAWSRPAAAGGVGGGYLVLTNHSKKADALVKVESPAAREVQVHQTSMAGGMVSMAPALRVSIPAGGSVNFAPGGYHLMFMGLKKALNPGDTLPATFTFASGAKLKAAFKVQVSAPAAAQGHP